MPNWRSSLWHSAEVVGDVTRPRNAADTAELVAAVCLYSCGPQTQQVRLMFAAPFRADATPIQSSPCQTGGSTGLFHNVTNCRPAPAKSLLDCVTYKGLVHAVHYRRSLQRRLFVGVKMQHENSIQDEISGTKDIN